MPSNTPLRRLADALGTLAVAGIAAGLVAAGSQTIARGAVQAEAAAPPLPVPVRIAQVRREAGLAVTRRFTGQIAPPRQVRLGFEQGGRLVEVLAEAGDRVTAGTPLARMDTAALGPERAALLAEGAGLQAEAGLARRTLARTGTLAERGFRAEATEDEARFALARIEAAIAANAAGMAALDVRLAKATLTAPFDGLIGRRLADPGQVMEAGAPVLTLFENVPPRIEVGLPPDLAATLAPGTALAVDSGGRRYPARLVALRPDLDPATRTRIALVSLDPGGSHAALPAFGQTATLVLTQRIAEPGFWAPLSALREGAGGSWTVLAVDGPAGAEIARPAAVEVLHAEADRVFLRGALPDGARLVATAPDRLVPGERLRPLAE